MVDEKNMSLEELIKRDKMKKKAGLQGGKKAGIRGKLQNVKANKM